MSRCKKSIHRHPLALVTSCPLLLLFLPPFPCSLLSSAFAKTVKVALVKPYAVARGSPAGLVSIRQRCSDIPLRPVRSHPRHLPKDRYPLRKYPLLPGYSVKRFIFIRSPCTGTESRTDGIVSAIGAKEHSRPRSADRRSRGFV